ncbi:MAG TPA: outer membrane protein transport protein [Gammaproteobacteria bacterium]|nr:outer membrane protein transport protein [Gammaproteobacteria bacterium]
MNKKQFSLGILSAATATLALLASSSASAANFQLTEMSAASLGRAHSGGAAAAEDASSVWYNPAGLEELKNSEILGGYALIRFGADFSKTSATDAIGQPLSGGNGGSVGKLGGPMFVYYSKPLSDQLTFGFGLNTPFGLATKYDNDSIFRYQAIYSSVSVLNYNPTLAWRVAPNFSLGFGIDYQQMNVKLTNAVDFGAICFGELNPVTCTANGLTPQGHDGFFSAQASGHGTGWNLGALWDINSDMRLGFAYRSSVSHDLSGNASFTNVPLLFTGITQFENQGISSSFETPRIISLSYLQKLNDQWTLTADWSNTGWSSFDNLTINFANKSTTPVVVDEGLSNSNRFSIGADYLYSSAWTFRGGLALDKTPVPDPSAPCNTTTYNAATTAACTNAVSASRTARLPDDTRRWIAVGASWHVSDHSQWDIGYAHLFLGGSVPFNQLNANGDDHIVGTFKADADILGVDYRYQF